MTLRPPEFPFFPLKAWRATPEFLEERLPTQTRDPWARRDQWRYHEFFSVKNRLKRMFPGLMYGTIGFGVYVLYDQWSSRKTERH